MIQHTHSAASTSLLGLLLLFAVAAVGSQANRQPYAARWRITADSKDAALRQTLNPERNTSAQKQQKRRLDALSQKDLGLPMYKVILALTSPAFLHHMLTCAAVAPLKLMIDTNTEVIAHVHVSDLHATCRIGCVRERSHL